MLVVVVGVVVVEVVDVVVVVVEVDEAVVVIVDVVLLTVVEVTILSFVLFSEILSDKTDEDVVECFDCDVDSVSGSLCWRSL